MEKSQETTPGRLSEGLSLEVARKAIEQLPINGWDKVFLVLTILDFKVGTDITPPDDELLLRRMEASLRDLKLSYIAGQHGDWYVAKSQSEAERLHQVFEVTPDIREQGRLLGYPESAVENYARTMEQICEPGKTQEEVESILRENNGGLKVPSEISRQAYMVFCGFELSADNWQNELATVKKWAEAIWNFDVRLYQGIVDSRYDPIKK